MFVGVEPFYTKYKIIVIMGLTIHDILAILYIIKTIKGGFKHDDSDLFTGR